MDAYQLVTTIKTQITQMSDLIVVHARHDNDVHRWWATSDDDKFSLTVETNTFDELRELVPELIRDLTDGGAAGTLVEIIAQVSAIVPSA